MNDNKHEYCKLCQEKVEGPALMCSKGTLCMDCSSNIQNAECQPCKCFDMILWNLAETYFRKGKGEKVSFEQVWKENEEENLIRFMDLLKLPKEN